MKRISICVLFVAAIGLLTPALWAAPVESVNSACASLALQKVDAFLAEQVVASQLTALGLDPADVRARVSQLSETELEGLAAQIDQLSAGGTIQGGGIQKNNPIVCMFQPLGRLFYNIFQILFCWGRLK